MYTKYDSLFPADAMSVA